MTRIEYIVGIDASNGKVAIIPFLAGLDPELVAEAKCNDDTEWIHVKKLRIETTPLVTKVEDNE